MFEFNALFDKWLPVIQVDGSTVWASPVEVWAGAVDGVDLDFPRDDFRVYARLLLSALTQALLAPANAAELRTRLEEPLAREELEARLAALKSDFDLFGPTPFLQVLPPPVPPEKGAAPFVFGAPDLYQPAVPTAALSLPIALITLFIEQTYAGGAGRGYGAGPGGQPGVFTLIEPGSIRKSAWANTLTRENAARFYAADGPRPWSNEKRPARARTNVGLVEGLFFQPRAIYLTFAGEGVCSFTGRIGPLVKLSPFLPKSELSKKPSNSEDLWIHPCAPMAKNSQGLGAIRLKAEQPAWTGLAQLLDPISRETAKKRAKERHPLEGPARVLQQWKSLSHKMRWMRLLILDFDRDKANIRRRFFEGFQLTDDFLENQDTIEALRALVDDAQQVERTLLSALAEARADRATGGLAQEDARTAYWAASEPRFLDWLDSTGSAMARSDASSDLEIHAARERMLSELRSLAKEIFDRHVSTSEFDPRKQERVAVARRRLRKKLSSGSTQTNNIFSTSEVGP